MGNTTATPPPFRPEPRTETELDTQNPTGWMVLCEDHRLRHPGQMWITHAAALYFADWGHCCTGTHRILPTRLYVARFPKAQQADAFYRRITSELGSWHVLDVQRRARNSRTITWHGPATREAFMDMAETVGYYGSPPQGPVATLNDRPTPRSW